MQKTSCCFISFGVESGSQKVLDRIYKGIKLTQVFNLIKTAKKLKIYTQVFFIFGHPEETLTEANETVKLIRKIKNDINKIALSGATSILPGTFIEKFARENNYLPKDFSWTQKYYCLENLTIGRDPTTPSLIQPSLAFKELRQLRYAALKEEIFTFKKILNVRIKSFKDIKKYLLEIKEIIRWKINSLWNKT